MKKFFSGLLAASLVVERVHQFAKTHSPQYKKKFEDSIEKIKRKLRFSRTAYDEVLSFLEVKELPPHAFSDLTIPHYSHTWPYIGEFLSKELTPIKEIGISHGQFSRRLDGRLTIDIPYEFDEVADISLTDCSIHDGRSRVRKIRRGPACWTKEAPALWPRGFFLVSYKDIKMVLTELHISGEHVFYLITRPEDKKLREELQERIEEQMTSAGPYNGWVIEGFFDKKMHFSYSHTACQELRKNPVIPNRETYSPAVRFLVEHDIPSFINRAAFFEQQKKDSRRSYLLAGPPGTGKSHIIQDVISSMPNEWVTLIIDDSSVGHLTRIEDIQPLLLIIEDLDLLVARGSSAEQSLLNFLDGISAPKQMITLITTNNLGKLSPALIDRPGRIDKILTIGPGDIRERTAQLDILMEGTTSPLSSLEIAERTEGFTFAQYREVVRRSVIYSDEPTYLNKIEIAIQECVEENKLRKQMLS